MRCCWLTRDSRIQDSEKEKVSICMMNGSINRSKIEIKCKTEEEKECANKLQAEQDRTDQEMLKEQWLKKEREDQQRDEQEREDQERALKQQSETEQANDALLSKSWTVKKFNRGIARNKEYETKISLDRTDVNEFAVVLKAELDTKHEQRKILVKDITGIKIVNTEKQKVSIFTTDGPVHGPKYKIKCRTEKEAAEWLVVLERFRTE